jgi:hypothetical protein
MAENKTTAGLYNKVLTDAVRDIYRAYGPNLAAFFRDVERPTAHGKKGKTQIYAYFSDEGRPRRGGRSNRRVLSAQSR